MIILLGSLFLLAMILIIRDLKKDKTKTTTTSTTAAPVLTTTTTLQSEFTHYYANKYSCEGCNFIETGVLVALPSVVYPIYGNYYSTSAKDGYAYKLISKAINGPGLILTGWNSDNCSIVCSVE